MISSRAPLWTLHRAHHSPVSCLSCWASGTSTAPTARISVQLPQQQVQSVTALTPFPYLLPGPITSYLAAAL